MILKLEKTLITFEGSNWLKSFVDEALTLTTSDHRYFVDDQETGNLRIYRAKFCVAVMKHYADKGRKQALFSLIKFAEMGFNTWVQQITVWEPPSDMAEIKADIAEIKQTLQQLVAVQTVLPASMPAAESFLTEAGCAAAKLSGVEISGDAGDVYAPQHRDYGTDP